MRRSLPHRSSAPRSPVTGRSAIGSASGTGLIIFTARSMSRLVSAVWAIAKANEDGVIAVKVAGIAIVLVVVFLLPQFLGHFGIAFDPVGDTLGRIMPWAIRTILLLSGNGDPGAEGIDV